jgi:hypothetical protein
MTRRLLGQPRDDSPRGQTVPEMDRALSAAGLPIPPLLTDSDSR